MFIAPLKNRFWYLSILSKIWPCGSIKPLPKTLDPQFQIKT